MMNVIAYVVICVLLNHWFGLSALIAFIGLIIASQLEEITEYLKDIYEQSKQTD